MLFNIWVTTACNMRCKYCYENSTDIKKMNLFLDIKTAEKMVDFVIEYMQKRDKKEYLIVNFHGGEPLLNFSIIKDIERMIRENFDNKRILFGITTNALLLENNEIIKFLADNFEYSLSISIDGTKKIHDFNRVDSNQKGTYDRVEMYLKQLLTMNAKVRARMTITPETIDCMEESIDHLYNLGLRTIVPVLDVFNQGWTQENFDSYTHQLVNLKNKYGEYKDVSIGPLKEIDNRQLNGECNPLDEAINICSDGLIYPCTYSVGMEDFVIGSVFEGLYIKKIDKILAHNKEKNSVCSGCNNYKFCKGTRCKIINKILMGDYNTPSPVWCCIENSHIRAERSFKCNTQN